MATYIKRIPFSPLLWFSNSVPQFAYMQSQACRLFRTTIPAHELQPRHCPNFNTNKQSIYIFVGW